MLPAVPTAVETTVTFASLLILGYVLGSCPWGYWLVRVFRHEDVRKGGSGNVGATNVWRSYGPWLGIPVVLLDVLKGVVPADLGVQHVSYPFGVLPRSAALLRAPPAP